MRATLRLPRRASYADFLIAEQDSPTRHEFLDGVIVAMAGGSDEHNAISHRFAVLFGNRLSPPCRGYTADQRFWISGNRHGRYADGSIICGKPDHPAHDPQATTNPTVVLEVLSPTSEGDDEGAKREEFQSLATLQAYVLTAQDAREVRVYRRAATGAWNAAPDVYRDGDSFELPMLSKPIAVAEVYDDILDAAGQSLLR